MNDVLCTFQPQKHYTITVDKNHKIVLPKFANSGRNHTIEKKKVKEIEVGNNKRGSIEIFQHDVGPKVEVEVEPSEGRKEGRREKKMDSEWYNDVPCSSIAVESIISVGTGGLIWGSCAGSYDAKKIGLTGIDRASFVAKTVGKYGFQCGLFAGIFSFTRCGIRRYRKKSDWVNALVAGAAIGAGSRNWKQVAVMTAFLSGFCAIADQSTAI